MWHAHIHIRFTWQAWHLRHWAGFGSAPGSPLTPWTPRLFAWQAWHLVTSTFVSHLKISTFVPRGRRGTWAGVALGHIHICFTWQAWHLRHWAGSGGAPGSQLTAWTPRLFAWQACNGAWQHRASLCVAGVALGHIHIRFTWQAWHFPHWASFGGALGSQLTPSTPQLFAWQAFHWVTSTFISHLQISTFVSRGRRGNWSHPHSFHVASVALNGPGRALVGHWVLS